MFETLVVRMLALVGIFFTGVNPDIGMGQPVVELRGDLVAVSCVLEHPLSDDLAKVIDSGTEVELTFVCRLRYADGTPTEQPDTTISHTVHRDLASGNYVIDLGGREVLASQITDHSTYFRIETEPLWPLSGLAVGGNYIVDISAELEPIFIHSTGQSYNLMSLWNFEVPREQSETFSLQTLGQRQVDR